MSRCGRARCGRRSRWSWSFPRRSPASSSSGRCELLISRLLAHGARRGRTLRALRLSARLAAGGGWRRQVALRRASADRARLADALLPHLALLPCPGRDAAARGRIAGTGDGGAADASRAPSRSGAGGSRRRCARPVRPRALNRCCGCSRWIPSRGCLSGGRCSCRGPRVLRRRSRGATRLDGEAVRPGRVNKPWPVPVQVGLGREAAGGGPAGGGVGARGVAGRGRLVDAETLAKALLRAGARGRQRRRRLLRNLIKRVALSRTLASMVPAAGLMYVELHCHSAYSFLDGASDPAELAATAAGLGHEALALTDHDNVCGAMEFAHACGGVGVRPIVGCELTVEVPRRMPRPVHVTLLVEDAKGWANLCRLITARPSRNPRCPHQTGCALAHPRIDGSRCRPRSRSRSWSATPMGWSASLAAPATARSPGRGSGEIRPVRPTLARRLLRAFGRDGFRIELQRPLWRHDRSRNRWLASLAERLGVPTVATGGAQPTSARACLSRMRWWRCGWGRRWTRPRGFAGATRPPPCSPVSRRRRGFTTIRRPSRRRSGSPIGCASISPASSATAIRARRTAARIGGLRSSAGCG